MKNKILENKFSYSRDGFYDVQGISPLLTQYIKPIENKASLDIGCGSGIDSKFLKDNGYTTTAIDINPVAIQKAINSGIDAKLLDFREYIWQSKFDLILVLHCLQHIKREEAKTIITKCMEHLNQAGLLFIGLLLEKKNVIDKRDIKEGAIAYSLELIDEHTWERVDHSHGPIHTHKGYWCIYNKI
ncbi:MAG: class I SAM-dependent methyltransferase [bacterium]|nr:class I SAM-dependent methyltransferase [bacterium]